MFAEIITIGDEILIGQIIDSNSAFMGKELNKIGVDVHQITSIRDDRQHILDALDEASKRADIVLLTGGLGPTKDDITKHTICEYFDDTLVQNDQVLAHIEKLFAKYISTPISEVNKQQALVPKTSTVLMNLFGTAPGMWLEKENKVFISMPGVPYEMKGLMKNEVLPRLQKRFDRPYIIHKTILTYGLGESSIAEKIEDWENDLPSFIKLAYLPNLGNVRLRLSARGNDKNLLEDTIESKVLALHDIIGDIIVGYEEDETIEVRIGKLLVKQNKTLSLAESCTGGKIAQLFTSRGGASAYFQGAVVTYATQSKVDILGVDEEIIKKFTVTSAEVAEAMALCVKEKFKSDYAIATTGNAGPEKGDGDVEVGTVFIAIASPNGVFSEKFVFSNLRDRTIGKAVNKSFELLLRELRLNKDLIAND
ncbi:CinA family nicotinamide mononucleotide deamidase-related protein [Aquimarina algiphila]|uniref:CinA-like protein n=1 Tax=Aquimarina algiphila TaxID=2047982 RepID=A0A554VQ66_9FLAO|nr:CinA family nicotinamide mononucleotide deamidase-related protein [Aquimarina algiphila]TSE10676.1 CinA family nicotinamide mononucleotide deamidase-related protein [Aquimarina algiphila]